jgi:fluoride exporter
MLNFLLVAVGGAIGSVLRYGVSAADYRWSKGVFPVSTLIVNVVGSLIIGFLWGLFDRTAVPSHIRNFVFIGILGGFTTFSSFSLESFNLLRDGELKIAAMNILANNLFGLSFVFVGFFAARLMINFIRQGV